MENQTIARPRVQSNLIGSKFSTIFLRSGVSLENWRLLTKERKQMQLAAALFYTFLLSPSLLLLLHQRKCYCKTLKYIQI